MTLSPPPIVDLEAASRRTFCAVCGLAFTNFFRRRRHQLGHQLEKQAARAKAAKMAAVKAAAALVVAEEAAGQIEQQQLSSKENATLDISLVGVVVAGNCDSDINSSRSSSPKNHNNHNNSSDSDSIELTAIINSNSNANSNSNSVHSSSSSSSSSPASVQSSHHSADDGGSSATATANLEEGASSAAAAVKTKKTAATKGRKRGAALEEVEEVAEVEKEVDDGRCSPVRLDVDLAYRRFRHCRDPVKNSASLLQSPENISTSTSTSPGSNHHHNLLRPTSPVGGELQLSSRSRRKLPFLLPGHLTQVGVLVTAGACPRSEPPQVITPGGQVLDGRLVTVAGAGTKKTKSAKMIISGGGDQNEDQEEEEVVREVQAHGAARMEVRRRGKRKFVAIIQNAITTRTRSRQAAATASIVDPAVPGPSTSARTGGEVEDHDEDHEEEEEEEEDRLSRRTKRMRITEPTTPPEA